MYSKLVHFLAAAGRASAAASYEPRPVMMPESPSLESGVQLSTHAGAMCACSCLRPLNVSALQAEPAHRGHGAAGLCERAACDAACPGAGRTSEPAPARRGFSEHPRLACAWSLLRSGQVQGVVRAAWSGSVCLHHADQSAHLSQHLHSVASLFAGVGAQADCVWQQLRLHKRQQSCLEMWLEKWLC